MKTKYIFLTLLVLTAVITGFLNSKRENQSLISEPSTTIISDLIDPKAGPVNLVQFRGNVVLINNWATWCPPCIAEMPSLHKLKESLKNENIIFVMVSYDENQDKALNFIQKKNFDFDVYFPGKKYPYHTTSIPATFVLDKNGNVVAKHEGMANFDSPELIKKIKSFL